MRFLNLLSVTSATALLCGCGSSDSQPITVTNEEQQTILTPIISPSITQPTQNTYAMFNVSSDQTEQFECQLNDGSITECTSPINYFGLESGTQTLKVWAVVDGRLSDASEFQWTIDSVFNAANPHTDLVKTNVAPSAVEDASWRGIFRINCDFSHASYNDPIVYPNQENAAHLHRFYGNTLVDHQTTTESLYSSGDSTCQGNYLNRSAYWVPTLLAPQYDAQTGEPILDEQGDTQWQVVPAVVGNDDEAHEVFYYSAGIDKLDDIKPIPAGLKIIAGDHMGQPGQAQSTSIVRWHCQSWESNDATNPRFSSSIPECVAPDRVRMDVFFPSCWNGTDLDSSDHKSHMAYPINQGGPNGTVCPSSHPVPVVRVSYHYAFGVKPDVYHPQSKASQGWRLASDMYTVDSSAQGGMSLHADWFNGWHPEIMQTLIDNCIKGALDCHDGNLANGFRLTGTREGSQNEPEIINGGRGH